MIRIANDKDVKQLTEIYNYYIKNSVATFAEIPLSEKEMQKKIDESFIWYVYEVKGEILAYASAGKYRARSAYRFTVESSVYVKYSVKEKGVGSKLYSKLLKELKQREYHSVIGVISLPNDKSIALHEKFGFKKVGQFNQTGFKFGKWVDVGYWQLVF